MSERIAIADLLPAEFTRRLTALGRPAYRARQVLRWLYQRGAISFDEMTDLPLRLRKDLAERFALFTTRVVETRAAADETVKLLVQLADGHLIETVVIPQGERRTACISTSVGCGFRCAFCASGLKGLARPLTAGEMVEQVLYAEKGTGAFCAPVPGPAHPVGLQAKGSRPLFPSRATGTPSLFQGEGGGEGEDAQKMGSDPDEKTSRGQTPFSAITNLVVMGIGEPLANLPVLTRFLEIVNDPAGLHFGARRVTISTVGLPEPMRALGRLGLQVHLAVSLHAPDDKLRDELVPANRGVGIKEILAAAADYFAMTGRRVTYEYCLLGGVNDSDEQAKALGRLLSGSPALVNVIPYNPVAGLPFKAPAPGRVKRFCEALRQAGIEAHVRRRRGGRIDAACGQLRADRLT